MSSSRGADSGQIAHIHTDRESARTPRSWPTRCLPCWEFLLRHRTAVTEPRLRPPSATTVLSVRGTLHRFATLATPARLRALVQPNHRSRAAHNLPQSYHRQLPNSPHYTLHPLLVSPTFSPSSSRTPPFPRSATPSTPSRHPARFVLLVSPLLHSHYCTLSLSLSLFSSLVSPLSLSHSLSPSHARSLAPFIFLTLTGSPTLSLVRKERIAWLLSLSSQPSFSLFISLETYLHRRILSRFVFLFLAPHPRSPSKKGTYFRPFVLTVVTNFSFSLPFLKPATSPCLYALVPRASFSNTPSPSLPPSYFLRRVTAHSFWQSRHELCANYSQSCYPLTTLCAVPAVATAAYRLSLLFW